MELWQLRTFSIVAKTLHFTRASEDLNLSQPAVSHHIKSLEEEIGEPLFLRTKDGVSLTRTGERVYEHAVKILDLAEKLSLEINEINDSLNENLVIGAANQGLNNPFPQLYRGFTSKYREIKLEFQTEKSPQEIAEKVRAGEMDVGVLGEIRDLSGLNVMPYGRFEFVLVAGTNNSLANKKNIEIEDLQNKEWVMLTSASRLRMWAEEVLEKSGIRMKKILETNDGSLISSMLANGDRLSLLPAWGVFEDIRDGKIVRLDFDGLEYSIDLICVWKKENRKQSVQALLTYLLTEKMEGIDLKK